MHVKNLRIYGGLLPISSSHLDVPYFCDASENISNYLKTYVHPSNTKIQRGSEYKVKMVKRSRSDFALCTTKVQKCHSPLRQSLVSNISLQYQVKIESQIPLLVLPVGCVTLSKSSSQYILYL